TRRKRRANDARSRRGRGLRRRRRRPRCRRRGGGRGHRRRSHGGRRGARRHVSAVERERHLAALAGELGAVELHVGEPVTAALEAVLQLEGGGLVGGLGNEGDEQVARRGGRLGAGGDLGLLGLGQL